jgi:hypothetical protein
MVTSQYQPAKQAGNGSTLAFQFNFKILAATDLVVSKLDTNGVSSGTLVLGVDYTVTFDPIQEVGTVAYTVAPLLNGFSVIERESNNQQQSSLPREGVFPAKTVETMIDKAVMLAQELLQGNVESTSEQSGLYADKPVNGGAMPYYWYSTDRQTYEKWVPAANAWLLMSGGV